MIETASSFVLVGAFSGTVAITELISRFRDEPLKVVKSRPGLAYSAINVAAGVTLLLVAVTFGWRFGVGQQASPWQLAMVRAVACGLGTAALLRSSVLSIRGPDGDLNVGPGLIVERLLAFAEKSADRERAVARLSLDSLDGLSFSVHAASLVELCSYALQTYDLDDARALATLLNDLRSRSDLDDASKLDRLGLALLDLVGEKALAAAVDRIRSRAGQLTDPVLAQSTATLEAGSQEHLVLLSQLIELQPTSSLLHHRARIYLNRGNGEAARADLDAAMKIAPADPAIGLERARLGGLSIGTLRRVVESTQGSAEARVLLCRALVDISLMRIGVHPGELEIDQARVLDPILEAKGLLLEIVATADRSTSPFSMCVGMLLAAISLIENDLPAVLAWLSDSSTGAKNASGEIAVGIAMLQRAASELRDEMLDQHSILLYPRLSAAMELMPPPFVWRRPAAWLVSNSLASKVSYIDVSESAGMYL